MNPRYDAIIVGAGQAGPPLARRLAGDGMSVAIVERHRCRRQGSGRRRRAPRAGREHRRSEPGDASGLEVCRRIRARNPRAQVIVISGMFDQVWREAALAAGAASFFSKLAPADELIAAMVRAWTESTRS